MPHSLKTVLVLLLTIGLIAFIGDSFLLMASTSPSHSTHFFSGIGPRLPHNESGCYVCHADGVLQCDEDGPKFWDNKLLGATLVCDTCHSEGGIVDGVAMAKANWADGVYQSNGETLKAGKEQWCVSCHDGGTSVCDGVSAPNVDLYYTSGHGRTGAGVECLVCHDAAFTHIDGEARTYAFSDEDVDPVDGICDIYAFGNSGVGYASGYRLRYVDGKVPLMIPASTYYTFNQGDDAQIILNAYRRCFDSECHDSAKLFSSYYYTGIQSNFTSAPPDPPRSYGSGSENYNEHEFHLIRTDSWDSDWDVNTDIEPELESGCDAMITCSSCHNVHGSAGTHGSTNEPMIRDGSLVGRAGFGFSYLIEDPAGYPWVTSEGATQATSVGAVLRNCMGDMCCGCHSADPAPDTSYNTASMITHYEGPHTGSTSDNTLKVDGTPWTEGALVGKYVKNITDGSYGGEIIGNTSNTVTVEELFGGTDNLWEPGDNAEIYEYTYEHHTEYFRSAHDYLSSADMIWTYDSHGGKDYSLLSAWEGDTDIDITLGNDVMVLSHSGMTGAIASGDTVTGENSGATGIVVGVVTAAQICIDVTSGNFQNGEQIYKSQDLDYVVSTSAPDHVGVMYLDCYDGPHNDYVMLSGATTDVAHYRCIRSASDCALLFSGKRKTGAYFESDQDNHVFHLSENFARLEHIGAKLAYTSDTNSRYVFYAVGQQCKIIGCVAYDSINYHQDKYAFGFYLGNLCKVVNSIAHDIEAYGFTLYYTGSAYNCTAVNSGGHGFVQSYSSVTVVWNCVGDNNGTAGEAYHDFSSDYVYTCGYNMSSDDTAPGENSKTNKDFTNMWVGVGDYHLSETGVADTDFEGGSWPDPDFWPSDYILTDDIDGEPRSIWYRGADESGPLGRDYQNISIISGWVSPADGVYIIGLPGNPVTRNGGFYSAVVANGWSGTATPTKNGYTFDPSNRVYSNVTTDQTYQDYTPIINTYTISGSVGVEGVTMKGLPGDPVSGVGGFYSAAVYYAAYVNVTPTKAGYRFDPSYRRYWGVTSDQTNQDYTSIVTHVISGNVGTVYRAYMYGLNPSGDVYTDADGFYSHAVDDGWSGTVHPGKTGYAFDPASRQYSNVTSDQTNQDYTPTEFNYTISGSVGTLDGVTMDGLPGDPVTSGGGFYSATVGYGWSGYVTPMKVGYNFSPERRYYSSMTSDKTNQDYTPATNTYIVSGYVGTLDSVTMSGLPGDPVTSGGGFYSATVDWGWSGSVTPTKAGYTFDPANRGYSYVTYDQESQDYTPTSTSTTVRFGDNTGDDFAGQVEDAVFPGEAAYRDNNYGAALYNHAGSSGSNGRRSLIRFRNIGTYIPAGRVISSATLYLYCSSENSTTDYSISAYRVLLNWGEGNSNGTPEVGAVCTNDAQYDDIIDWNSIGCDAASDVIGEDSTADRRATAEDSCLITGTGWFAWDLTTAVQNWYSAAWSEYGVILVNDSASVPDSVKLFHSSESSEDGKRPYLEVTYAAP